jgi:hypothetical protein
MGSKSGPMIGRRGAQTLCPGCAVCRRHVVTPPGRATTARRTFAGLASIRLGRNAKGPIANGTAEGRALGTARYRQPSPSGSVASLGPLNGCPIASTPAGNSGTAGGFPVAHNFLDRTRKPRAFLEFRNLRYGRPVLHRGSEMGLNGRWLFMALLAVAIVALAGCAASGSNLLAEPCGGFYMCTSWH